MTDIYDRATEIEEREREASIERVRSAAAGGRVVTLTCLECGSPIAPARVRAVPGTTTCIDCATELEHEAKLRRQHERE
jgi:phage/conjugal plasmid C-4 type zinc finger TraR family protein